MAAPVSPPQAPIRYNATFDSFDTTLSQALDLHAPGEVIVYLFAERDAQTNLSWCPDCRRSDDYLRAAFARAATEGLTVPPFIDASVGPRESYKNNPQHPYRQHPKIQLKCVPTLIRWSKQNGPGDRLEEPPEEALVWNLLFSKQCKPCDGDLKEYSR